MPSPATPYTSAPRHNALAASWRKLWGKLSAREQTGVLLATLALGGALMWWGWLAPALQTLKQAPAAHARLDAQLQTMQTLAAQARALQSQPTLNRDDSLRALEQATTQHLGSAGALKFAGDQATVTLQATHAAKLANWLADVRSNARLTPAEARLTQANAAQATWQGTVVFTLSR